MEDNYGFIKDEVVPEDYIFGVSLPFDEWQSDGNWVEHLPKIELQSRSFESYSCVPHTILNCVEILIRRQYGEERDYSDRFLAVLADTKQGGSSPKAVLQFLRKIGVPMDKDLPFVDNQDEYFKELNPKLMELAKDFIEEWDLRYEDVPQKDIEEALKTSPLAVSVPAWTQEGDFYTRRQGKRDNHFTTMYKKDWVFDTYVDNSGGVLKPLKDIDHEVIKRFRITKRVKDNLKDTDNWVIDLLKRLLNIFK